MTSTTTNDNVQKNFLEKILEESKGIPNEEKTTKIFKLMCDGESHEKSLLALAGGYTSPAEKTFKTLIERMDDMELLQFNGKGTLKLTDRCFPSGRPKGDEQGPKAKKQKTDSDGLKKKDAELAASDDAKKEHTPIKKGTKISDGEHEPKEGEDIVAKNDTKTSDSDDEPEETEKNDKNKDTEISDDEGEEKEVESAKAGTKLSDGKEEAKEAEELTDKVSEKEANKTAKRSDQAKNNEASSHESEEEEEEAGDEGEEEEVSDEEYALRFESSSEEEGDGDDSDYEPE